MFFAAASRLPLRKPPLSLRAGFLNFDPLLDRNSYTGIARVEGDLGFATATSISACKKLDVKDQRDLDGSSLDTIGQVGIEHSKQFTQELRLTSNPDGGASFGGAFDWILGAFYYDDKSDRRDIFGIGIDSLVRAAAGTPATDTVFADYKITSYALFGQGTIHFSDALDLTLGGRYTKDKKRITFVDTTTDAAPMSKLVSRDELYARHAAATRLAVNPESMRWYTLFSLFKLAVTHIAAAYAFERNGFHDMRMPAMATQIAPTLRQIEKALIEQVAAT